MYMHVLVHMYARHAGGVSKYMYIHMYIYMYIYTHIITTYMYMYMYMYVAHAVCSIWKCEVKSVAQGVRGCIIWRSI